MDRGAMSYTPPDDELIALCKAILAESPDELAYHKPAVTAFYFMVDSQKIARALLSRIKDVASNKRDDGSMQTALATP
jgi:hypothetical protein